ncbi:unnamed protein product [Anisakis simplex]|uniref:Myotubularin-related protein 13 n=1 Tax=Anisakis simplex TaxID=6269 RepID=A0A0M3JS52_ANISI|nr:unnamed protein product [Anisakis simplex]
MDGNERGSVRLVDYIVVIAFDESQIRHGNSVGNIVQRLPKYDWPDISLSPNLEVFSQPQGWSLSTEVKPPTFFFNTLTDILGSRQYAYCLQLQEPCGSVIEEDFDDLTLNGTLLLYKPKVIVILSRFPFFELFRNCLNRLHLAILDSECSAETMAATLLSNVLLSVGASAITINVAAERLNVRAPLSLKVPVTADKVALFVEQMGTIQNILTLLVAIMTDRKVLFRSSSLTRLADSCYAICALLYPFEYPHTFVPVLPEILMEYLESPTPYIMGLLNSIRSGLNVDLETTIIVELDIGAIHIPNTVVLPALPEPYAQRFINSLQMVLNPSLVSADDAWKMGQPPYPSREVQDKRIRACFIRFFAELLAGYRCCLEVVRIHTPPLILVSQSVDILLNNATSDHPSKTNVAENITEIAEKLRENEHQDTSFSMTPLLTHKRFLMSSNLPTKLQQFDEKLVARLIEEKQKKMLSTSGGVSGTVMLSSSCASAVGQSGVTSVSNNNYIRARKVPTTTNWLINMNEERHAAVSRRLQVLSSCLRYIFDMKLSDARKMLCAVELSMRSVNARVALCQLLWLNLNPVNRATLLPQQFELIVRLINCALKQESKEDEHGIAYAMLYLSNIYCRRLTAGVHQFVYTCIQEHDVWENEQFWEAAFFHDVHRQLRRLYMPVKDDTSDCPFSVHENVSDTWNLMEEPSGMDLVSERLEKASKYDESELKRFAAEENSIVFGQAKHYINLMVYLRIPLDVSKLRRVNVRELERRSDRNATRRNAKYSDVGSDIMGMSAIAGSAIISDMMASESGEESDVESGFIESDDGDLGNVTVKWIRRLIDRICSSVGLEHAQIERLCDEIPGFVALHIDNLEQVYTESKRLSPMHKPKLLQPALLLPAERILIGGMRVFLLNDGRMTIATNTQGVYSADAASTPQCLLPAEGAIFLTNYRVIFKGQPCDPFLCEQVVVRTIAIMSITKEKQIADQSLLNNTPQLDGIPLRIAHQLHDAFQIRTCNAQLMKVAFDEEVSSEKADEFIETLLSLRWPSQLPHTLFAYSQAASLLNSSLVATNNKHKYGTIRELKKTLLIRNPLKEKKRVTPSSNRSQFNKLLLGTYTMNGSNNNNSNNLHDNINTLPTTSFSANASPATARLSNNNNCSDYLDLSGYYYEYYAIDTATNQLYRHYLLDYDRLGLTHQAFRLSNMNHKYELSKSYPSVLVVPSSISDESFTKINKGFKHGRFPVVVWKSHSEALLIRGASLTSQTVVARLKKQANLLGAVGGASVGTASDTHSYSSSVVGGNTGSRISLNSRNDFFNSSSPPNTVEMQERYMNTLMALSPHTSSIDGNLLLSESLESLLSLNSMITIDASSLGSATPDNARKPYSLSNSSAPSCSMQTTSGIGSSSTYASDSIRYAGNYVQSNNVTAKTAAMKCSLFVVSLGTARTAAAMIYGGGSSEYSMGIGRQQPLTRRANTFLPSSSSSSAQSCNNSTTSCNVKFTNRPLISLTRNSMYIFGDRNQVKMMKLEKGCEFVPVAYPSAHNVKIAFKKFLRAMCPSWIQSENDHSNTFLKICSLLNVSNAVVDLIDVQHSSVCLCIEDGWDATCQLSSLSQILLDPFYRTIDGLRVLIEKEWLAFGHRFSHRANHSVASQNSGIAPMFLMFLDALHQIHEQYPSAFEFNDFFLRFLAYHSSSAHFRTFLLDSECERLMFDSLCSASSTSSNNSDDFTTSLTSIWNYINQKRKRCSLAFFNQTVCIHFFLSAFSPIFANFCYAPQFYTGVLRPQASIASVTVWSFFVEDYLAHGSPYDLGKVAELEEQEREDEQFECTSVTEMQHSKGLSLSSRRVLDANYREMELLHLDAFSTNLNNYSRIGALLPPSNEDEKSAANNESCQSIMHSVDAIISSTNPASISFTLHDFNTKQPKPLTMISQWRSHLQRAVHKKETLKLLLRGISTHQTNTVATSSTRMRDSSIANGSSVVYCFYLNIGHHHFVSQHVTVGDTCAVCHQNVPGVIVRNGCGMICHEKCSQLVSSICSSSTQSTSMVQDEKQRRSVTPKAADPSQTVSVEGLNGEDSKTLTISMGRYHPHTNATHCGFLMKKGATFKMWKPRWFVLDSMRHQIRYYENETDLNCRGIIELSDIKAVDTSCSHALRKPLIEIKTVRRVYSLLAETKNDADTWAEKILGALRD